MNCKYHKDLKATNTCSVCGEWLCENCVLEIDGRIYCKDCLKNKLKNQNNTEARGYAPEMHYTTYTYKNRKSSFITFICSFIPGVAQIYLGYTKRGLIILSFLLLGMYIEAFSPLILLCYIFGLFDAFRIKGNMERGIYQEDNVSDVKKFAKENKFFIAVLGVIIIIPMFVEFFEDIFEDIFKRFAHTAHHGFRILNIGRYDIEDILKLGGVILLILIIFNLIKGKKDNKNIDKIEDKKQ